ncbi:hypothetical protein AMST5_03004 [freshwater sediment metagenome]|uniref:Uncharacterized protein n=1 Tax=freshwater sediment metagenome TaxID=556182 RepID=A0AA48RE58_9ZZZZ
MSRLFERRLREAERRAPKPEDELRLTKGLSERECAEIYGRILHGEPLESVFPNAQIEPDPEPSLVEDACADLSAVEMSGLYTRMLHAKGREETRNLLHDQITRNRSRRL